MKNWQKIKQNPQLVDKFLIREKVIDAIRDFFKKQSFHEVETPLLVKHPGTEPFLEVFETSLKTTQLDSEEKSSQLSTQSAFLLTSPEFAMKKLVAGGVGNIFHFKKNCERERCVNTHERDDGRIAFRARVKREKGNKAGPKK